MEDALKRYQTRSEVNGVNLYATLAEAINAAENDQTVWKISWLMNDPGDVGPVRAFRLIRQQDYTNTWSFNPDDGFFGNY